jgi:integrase
MARRPRSSHLETRTARLKLPIAQKPYDFTALSPGIALGYRRCKSAGRWVVRVANGAGGMWTKAFAIADDFEEADGEHVLTWWQAQDRARTLARGTDQSDAGRPATLAEALDDYGRDLTTREADPYNAGHARHHLTPALLAKPVALLTAKELSRWRDGLVGAGVKAATVNRVCKALKAALNLAVKHDPRIGNREAWRVGLAGLPDTHNPRNTVLSDEVVRALIAAAWSRDPDFGLLVETLAVTGARASQVARLEVGDLQDGRPDPRVLMPSSRKGRSHKRIERRPLPIPVSLAAKLRAAAGNRPATEKLLLTAGARWTTHRAFAEIAARVAHGATAYALRHTSITRGLLAGVPLRILAAAHDTSTSQIEKTYSKFIADHSDAVTRAAMFDPAAPAAAGNVIPLSSRKG